MPKKLNQEEEKFIAKIAEQYYEMLHQYCCRCISYNTKYLPIVPDVVQATFLKAVENAAVLLQHENVPGWLKRSCYFSLMNMLRDIRSSREVASPAIDRLRFLGLAATENDAVWEGKISLNDVIAAARKILTEGEWIVFVDYFLNNLSTDETAMKNHLSHDAVRGRISRIRKKLKLYFQEEDEKE